MINDWLPFIVIGTVTGSLYGLAALGLVLTYRTSGVFNLAHGAVVADPALLSLTGMNPVPVRRASWIIGCSFAALTGILIAPTLGADAFLLSALVVQAFGAVAIGRFSSLPWTYVGGLIVGILAA